MTRLLGHWFRSLRGSSESPSASTQSSWQPLPEDIAEWMGMAPYQASEG